MLRKNFDGWMRLKSNLHDIGRMRTFHEGEIWWCAIGENIGIEINGKNKVFSRPVLVFKKLSCFGFLGIPLTSKAHCGSWYVPFVFQNKRSIAVLSQIGVISVSRLYERMGTLSVADLRLIQDGFNELYVRKNFPQSTK